MRILIAEQEADFASALKYLLEKNKFSVDISRSATDTLSSIAFNKYDVLVLDSSLPRIKKDHLLEKIREQCPLIPILMLTGTNQTEERVIALDLGADDCLEKPFAMIEFIARVKALSRRAETYYGTTVSFGNVTLDRRCYELISQNRRIRLNNKEFQLADLFFRYPSFIYPTDYLMSKVWNPDSASDVTVVWTYIGFLRKKLKQLESNIEIRTVRGAGYMLEQKAV